MSALGSAVSPSVRGQVYSVKSRSIKAVSCRAPVSVKAQIDNVAAAPVSAPRNDRPWFDVASARPRDVEDPFAVLQAQRVIFLGGEVDEMSADAVISQMLLLDAKDPMKDIKIFINSPGGSVTAGMGIYDAMHMCKGDISTLCFGLAASMGAFLLCAGKKGKRYSLPNSRIMIHQPLGGAGGQAIDIEIQAKEIMFHKSNLNRIMADNCDQPLNKMEADCDRDNYMNPIEAREYGLIDHIVGGDNKTYAVKGSMRRYPKLNKEYVTDKEDMLRSIIDGAPFLEYTPSYRFRKESEPYMRSLAPASPWFRLEQVSKERYKEMIDTQKAAQLEDKAAGVVDVEVKKPAKPVLL